MEQQHTYYWNVDDTQIAQFDTLKEASDALEKIDGEIEISIGDQTLKVTKDAIYISAYQE